MSNKTYTINDDKYIEVDGEVQAITHRSGMQMGPDPEGNMIINHLSGLLIKHYVGGISEIYNESNKLLHTFKVGENFTISVDGEVNLT